MRWLDSVIPQDNEGTGDNDRCTGTSKRDDENSQRGQHDNYRDEK